MLFVTLQEAETKLAELISRQLPGEELQITDGGETVAKLVVVRKREQKPRQLGTLKGSVLSMEHFDDPLDEFAEYTG